MALGVKDIGKAQEVGRSAGKPGRDEAGEPHRAMPTAWDARMEAWQALLDSGHQSLSRLQRRMAPAAGHAAAFPATNEDEPFDAPLLPVVPDPIDDGTSHGGHCSGYRGRRLMRVEGG